MRRTDLRNPILAAILAIAVAILVAAQAQAQDQPVDPTAPQAAARAEDPLAKYWIPEFPAVLVIDMQRLANPPGIRSIPSPQPHDLIPGLKRFANLEIDQLDRIGWALYPVKPEFGPAIPSFELQIATIVRFRRDIRQLDVDRWFGGPKRSEILIGYWTEPAQPFLADSRTVIIAPDAILKKMLANGRRDAPVRRLMQDVEGVHDFVLAFHLDGIRDGVREWQGLLTDTISYFGFWSFVPPPLAPFLLVIDEIRSGVVTASLSGRPTIRCTFEARDDAAAVRVEAAADLTRKALSLIVLGLRTRLTGDREIAQVIPPPSLRMLFDMAEESVAKSELTRRERTVSLSFTAPEEYEKFASDQLGPLVAKLEETRRRETRMANLKQIGFALHGYHSNFGSLPPPGPRLEKDHPRRTSWRAYILQLVEENRLHREYRRQEAWDSEHNKKLLARIPNVYETPDANLDEGLTGIVLVTGPGTAFAIEKELENGAIQGPTFEDITDGFSKTLLAIELPADKAVPWTKPADFVLDPDKPLEGLGKIPPEGLLAVMMDGSVHRIPPDIKPEDFKALCTCAGGEDVSPQDVLK